MTRLLNRSIIKKVDYHIILIDCFDGSYCPNVWFELGIIAITSQKPMILIAQEGMHDQFPFYIRNQINVLQFPKISFVSKGNEFIVDMNKLEHVKVNKFKNAFIEQFKSSTSSPFEMYSDAFHLELSGYKNLRELEERLTEIVDNTEIAEYIDGEEDDLMHYKKQLVQLSFPCVQQGLLMSQLSILELMQM